MGRMVKRPNKEERVEGSCMKCDRKTLHTIHKTAAGREYFECGSCGNRVDVKAFVYDSLDSL